MRKAFLAAVLVAVFAPTAAAKPKTVFGHEVLSALRGVHFVIDTPPADAQKWGLTKDSISRRVRVVLQRNGIQVLTYEQRGSLGQSGHLYVCVTTAGNGYSISVQQKELVILERTELRTLAATWEAGSVGTHGSNAAYILDNLERDVDLYAKDYLRANPKKPEPAKKK